MSSLAYQTTNIGISKEWISDLNDAGLPLPDLTFVLEVPVYHAMERVRLRGHLRDQYENRDTLSAAAENYKRLACEPGLSETTVRVEGNQSREAVEEVVWSLCKTLL